MLRPLPPHRTSGLQYPRRLWLQAAVALTFVALAVASGVAHAKPAEEAPHLRLIRVLPAKVPGFVADEPQGSTTEVMGANLAEASGTYQRGTGKTAQQVTIKITDGASSAFLPKDPDPATEFGTDDADSDSRSFTLDGFPALQNYDQNSKAGSLLVFVGGRYLVEIATEGLERKSLVQWWKKLALKQLTRAGR